MTTETTTTPVLGFIQAYAPDGRTLADHFGEMWETADLAAADLIEHAPDDPELWRVVAVVEVETLADAANGRRLAKAANDAYQGTDNAAWETARNQLMAWVHAGEVTR